MDFILSALPKPLQALTGRAAAANRLDPALCGWYDSSFDLRAGLDVIEQDDDDLYQLWQLAGSLKG
jgi:hypothetical protein